MSASSRVSRSRTSRRARSASRTRSFFIVAAVAIVALLLAHGLIEGAVVRGIVRTTLGYDLAFDRVGLGPTSAQLNGVRASVPGAAEPLFTADRVDLQIDWVRFFSGARAGFGVRALSASHPQLVIARASDGSLNVAPPARFTGEAPAFSSLAVHVRDGAIDFTDTSADGTARHATATAMNIDGTFGAGASTQYTAQLTVGDGAGEYPVVGNSQPAGDGTVVHHWTAEAFPLAVVQAVIPSASPLHLRSGMLREVDVTSGEGTNPGWRMHARLEAGSASVDGTAASLTAAHGTIDVDDEGVAIPRLEARLGETPFHVAGVMRNHRYANFQWVTSDPDLPRIAHLFGQIASQTHTTDVRLESLAPGVAYAQVATKIPAGPIVYNILAVDQHEPTVRLGTAIAQDTVISHGERTSDLAVRVGALAGLNGDYFDIGRTYEPQGILVRDGQLMRSPGERYAMAVHRDKRVTFDLYRFRGHVRTPHATFNLTQVNTLPAREVTLITPAFGSLVTVGAMTYVGLIPDGPHRFRVTGELRAGERLEPGYALVFGDESAKHGKPPAAGEVVSVDYDTEPSVKDVAAAVGGGPLLVHDGEWFEDKHAPAPDERDAHWAVDGVGVLADDSLLLFAVDGRHPERSVGMTRPEFGELMRSYGVREGFALDSGGSVTMVSRLPLTSKTAVRNVPSDNDGERWISDAFFVFSDAPSSDLLARR